MALPRVTSIACLVAAGLCFAPVSGQEAVDLVTLDVVAVDNRGAPISGLTAADFEIREDGKRVTVTTFAEVTPADDERARSLVILMDDVAVPVTGKTTMQTVAQALLARLRRRDDVSVVRLSREGDEAFGDRIEARHRIDTYQAGLVAFNDWGTPLSSLHRVRAIAEQLALTDGRRKIIACIGAPVVCNVPSPMMARAQNLGPAWREALAATARANVAVYAIIPGRVSLRGGGLADLTGGAVFATTYDVGPAIDRILQDAQHYYLLGYWPSGRARSLHEIEVKTKRRGVRIKARQMRGN
jgi:hypothetical protein